MLGAAIARGSRSAGPGVTWGDENALDSTSAVVTARPERTGGHWTAHFEAAHFMLCGFYFNLKGNIYQGWSFFEPGLVAPMGTAARLRHKALARSLSGTNGLARGSTLGLILLLLLFVYVSVLFSETRRL